MRARAPLNHSLDRKVVAIGWRLHQPDEPLPVFYCAPAAVDAGFRPVEAADAYEAEQIVQREHPGAVTASLSERVTNEEEIRRLFVAWLEKV